METLVIGGGCFWCIEAILVDLKGVQSVVSGYAGGSMPNPTYDQVCSGTTGHAEVVQVTFDPSIISRHDLLSIFMTLHDPTQLNRQGNDVGTQYRSVIFYANDTEHAVAEAVIRETGEAAVWDGDIVTTLEELTEFYPAEDYHQHYFELHPEAAYCQFIIAPKVTKLRKLYHDKLKK